MGFRFRLVIAISVLAAFVSTEGFAHPLKKSEANQIIPEGEYLVKSGRRVHGSRYAEYSKKKKKSVATRYVAVKSVKKPPKKKAPAKRYSQSKPSRKAQRYPASQSAARAKAKRKPASRAPKVAKKPAKKSARKPASRHAAKRPSAKKADRRHATSGPRKRHPFPVAKETPIERDMPFISVPHRTVSRHDKTIVMDDPAVKAPLPKPRRAPVAITPDQGVLDPASEGPPESVGEAKAAMEPPAPVVGPAPASVVEAPAAVPAEPATPEHVAAETATREPDAFDLHSGADPMQHGP